MAVTHDLSGTESQIYGMHAISQPGERRVDFVDGLGWCPSLVDAFSARAEAQMTVAAGCFGSTP